MTIWIMPESDREGWPVCLFWLQGGKHNEPADKKTSRTPPFFKKEGRKEETKSKLSYEFFELFVTEITLQQM